jgi:HAD superfamily hydrolase (TIGR01509 family)
VSDHPASEAVIFDLDGVLIDSEQRWNAAKEELVREAGGRWRDDAPGVMMGMSSPEWSAYLHDELGVPMEAEAISREVVRRMLEGYERELPLLPGASEAVHALAARWPLGLASSSNREVIDRVLELAGFGDAFRVAVSSEEVDRGKPAPDVYLVVAERLGVQPARCAAIEDSSNGLRAAASAGMAVIAVPNAHYPPEDDALSLASARVATVGAVTPELVAEVVRSEMSRM